MVGLVTGWLILIIFNAVLQPVLLYGLGACPRIGYMADFNASMVSFSQENGSDEIKSIEMNFDLILCTIGNLRTRTTCLWLISFNRGCVCGHGNLAYIPFKYDNQIVDYLTGHWYEIERSFYVMELISSCVSVDLDENNFKGQLDVYVKSRSRVSGIFSISEGTASPTKKDPSIFLYKVRSKLPRVISRYLPGAGYYQVVSTDYNQYAVLYSCSNFHLFHTDLVWIWARKKEIDAELRAKIYQMLNRNHIDPERLTLPKNKNCTDDY